MLFSPQMCTASLPSIPSHHSFWRTPSSGPVQNGSAVSECKLWQLCCGKDLLLTAENPFGDKLERPWLVPSRVSWISCMLSPSSGYSCGCVCVWAWVRNAWPCWEEWLLYSCLVGTMGARAVSLGSCMDDLRRSPSFIKHTPTCRIDLTKKRGGNSSSSVFPDHKSLGGVPPQGKRWHHCQWCSPIGQGKGQGQSPHIYRGSRMARKMQRFVYL